jgi:hypothetical protein
LGSNFISQSQAWCLAAYWGDKVHNGESKQSFAPSIQISELPVDLTVHLDCNAGSFSVLRSGRLLGGPYVHNGLKGKTLHLAVGSGDFRQVVAPMH